jgi:hypothetical protein
MALATVATDLQQLASALSRSHRMGRGSDWDRAHGIRGDLGAPVDPGLSPHAPGQP